jgi:hypothetical protein
MQTAAFRATLSNSQLQPLRGAPARSLSKHAYSQKSCQRVPENQINEKLSWRLFRLSRLNGHAPDMPALKAEKNFVRFVGHVLQQFGAGRPTHGARRADHGIPHAHRLAIACEGRITTLPERMRIDSRRKTVVRQGSACRHSFGQMGHTQSSARDLFDDGRAGPQSGDNSHRTAQPKRMGSGSERWVATPDQPTPCGRRQSFRASAWDER